MEAGFESGVVRPAPVPKMVQDFVVYFYRHIRERNIREIYTMYSNTFPHLSERFFKGSTWPPAEAIAHLVDHDHVFCMLYKEMRFRHLYASMRPTFQERIESWENYRELFGVILSSNLNMMLPNGWLWDIIDEFLYQFQSYAQYRGKVVGKSEVEIDSLKAVEDRVWDAQAVLAFLNELVARSGIREELSTPGGIESLYESEGYSTHQSNVRLMLGYFSLIGLLRAHTILGNPAAGMSALVPLNPHERKGLFATKIALSCITLYYYSGYAYLSMHRYLDAAKCINFVLTYIAKVKSHHQRGTSYEQILKKNEQLHALLAITTSLCPAAGRILEESVAGSLREKYGEKARAITAGDVPTVEELFAYACPKFVSSGAPDWNDATGNTNADAYKVQLQAFMATVELRKHLPALKQFLKLYTSIPITKLALLSEMDEDGVRQQLQLLQKTTQVMTWGPGSGDALSGSLEVCGDLDFSIEKQNGEEMVLVKETRQSGVKGDFLVRHIQRLADLARDLEAIAPAAPAVEA